MTRDTLSLKYVLTVQEAAASLSLFLWIFLPTALALARSLCTHHQELHIFKLREMLLIKVHQRRLENEICCVEPGFWPF